MCVLCVCVCALSFLLMYYVDVDTGLSRVLHIEIYLYSPHLPHIQRVTLEELRSKVPKAPGMYVSRIHSQILILHYAY